MQPTPATPTTASSLRQRFVFRARMLGVFEWICPECGTYNRSRMVAKTWRVRCGGAIVKCERVYAVGHVLHEIPRGYLATPPDYVIPLAEALQEGDVGRWWRNGHMMHCVHTATGTLAIPDAAPLASYVAEAYVPGSRPTRGAERRKRKAETAEIAEQRKRVLED